MSVGKNKEVDFSLDNYEDFYEHHNFEPAPEPLSTNIHEYIPRFGYGFDKVEEYSPQSLLDLGCLDGSFALTIAKHFNIPVRGVDLTEDGVNIATERADKFGLPATFYQGTIEGYLEAFADAGEKFDMITFFEVIEHVKDVQHLLKLIDKVLAPGGYVVVSTPDFEDPLYGKDDEVNKCHIRLYTTADEDYEAENKFGNVRKATSLSKEIGKDRIIEMAVHSHLINALYQ